MFLCSGSVIHGVSTQDIRKMGALSRILPITYVTMLIASLSLAGFPFLSGFYSKDYLLESSYSIFGQYAYLIYFISILSTTISSYYSFRLIFFVFFGDQAASIKTITKISESSYFLYTPLIILAIFSIFSGYYLKDLMTLQTSFYNFNVSIFNNITSDQEFFNDFFKILPTTFSILGLIFIYSVYVLKVKIGHKIYKKYILLSYLYCKKFFADAFNSLYVYLPSAKFSLNITYKLIDQGFLEQFGSTGIYNFLETIFKNLVNLETTLLIYRLLLFFTFSLGISIALFLNMSIIFIILFLIMSLVILNAFSDDNNIQKLNWILSFDVKSSKQSISLTESSQNNKFSSENKSMSFVLFFFNDYFYLELIFVFCLIFFLFKYIKPIFGSFYKEFFFCLTLVTMSFLFPTFQYFFMLFFSSIILFLMFPYIDNYIPKRKTFAEFILNKFHTLGLLEYFVNIYIKFFCQNTKTCFIQTICLYVVSFFYILTSKYIFLNKLFLWENNIHFLIMLYLILFISNLAVYYRLLLSTSIIFFNLTLNILKTEEFPDNPKNQPSSTPTSSESQISGKENSRSSLFVYTKNIHNTYQSAPLNTSRFRLIGLSLGFCTLCVGGYAAYQQRLQTIAAQESVRSQDKNNFEMTRQNDLEEVSQGLMSKESYQQKYGSKS